MKQNPGTEQSQTLRQRQRERTDPVTAREGQTKPTTELESGQVPGRQTSLEPRLMRGDDLVPVKESETQCRGDRFVPGWGGQWSPGCWVGGLISVIL